MNTEERIDTGPQQTGEQETPEAIRAALEQTREEVKGYSDEEVTRAGFKNTINPNRTLKAEGGGDGIYGHLVTLKIRSEEDSERGDFFSINQYSDGRMEILGLRLGEDGRRQGSMAAMDNEGNIIEAFPVDEHDMFKKKIGSENLSPEEIETFIKGVKSEFDNEVARRKEAPQA